jgi:uncharacterized protein YidB (DUF937 family)
MASANPLRRPLNDSTESAEPTGEQEQLMGMFDSILGAATQAAGDAFGQALTPGGASPDALMQGLAGLLNGSGANDMAGLAGLVSQFQQGGLGEIVASWVSTGANLPVSADQIGQVLGGDGLGRFAQTLGIDPQQAAGQLAHWLPQVVDGLTPDGQLPDGAPNLAGLLPQLLGGLFQR